MNFTDKGGIIGILHIEHIDRSTGEVVDEFHDRNTITVEGYNSILSNIAGFGDGLSSDNEVSTIVLGDDVGSGSPENPEPPSILSTYLDQSEVVNVDPADITITYPSVGEFVVSTILNGESLVDAEMVETIPYTSATIRLNSEVSLSYKRFPVKIISRLIDIRINWSIQFEQG